MKIHIRNENFNIKNHTNRETINTIINNIFFNLKKYEVKEIVTNGLIGSVLSDNEKYIPMGAQSTIFSIITQPYLYGSLHDIKIYINPLMKWSDVRIIPKYDITTIRKNKILKVLNKEYQDILEEIIIDKEIGDTLF